MSGRLRHAPLCSTTRERFPLMLLFFCYNHGKFIKIPLQIQPSYPLFLPKNRFLWYFSMQLQEIRCPVPCPTEVWCPIHHYAYRGVMPQHRDGGRMRCPMTRPTVRQKNAARCMGTCTALRFRGQNCGALAAADRGSESQAVPMPEERLPLRHHLRRPGWTKAVTGQKNRSAPPRLPHLPRKTRMERR